MNIDANIEWWMNRGKSIPLTIGTPSFRWASRPATAPWAPSYWWGPELPVPKLVLMCDHTLMMMWNQVEKSGKWMNLVGFWTLNCFIILYQLLYQFPITGHHLHTSCFFSRMKRRAQAGPGRWWRRIAWVMRFVIEMYRIVILKGITCDNDSNTVATSYRTNGWYCCDHTTIAFFFYVFGSTCWALATLSFHPRNSRLRKDCPFVLPRLNWNLNWTHGFGIDKLLREGYWSAEAWSYEVAPRCFSVLHIGISYSEHQSTVASVAAECLCGQSWKRGRHTATFTMLEISYLSA